MRSADPPLFPFPPDATKPWTPEEVAATMNLLPFVTWDRMIGSEVEDVHRQVDTYGWIERDDAHHDFVLMSFVSWSEQVGFSTSSAARSEEINLLLYGQEMPHFECQRVEDVLGPLVVRKVML